MAAETEVPGEVTDERILADLEVYEQAGLIDYVLPTIPLGEQWIIGWKGQILKFLAKDGIVGFLAGIQVCAVFGGDVSRSPVLEQISALSRARNAVAAAESATAGVSALSFLLDPDTSYEMTCPDCREFVSISCGSAFQGAEGAPLDHEPVLGDLIGAAMAHACPEGP